MKKNLKISALALAATLTAFGAQAQDSLLQGVSVDLTIFTQGDAVVKSTGTNNVVAKERFDTKALITALGGSPGSGDILIRSTPVDVTTSVTNLVPVSTNTLVITNESTSLAVSNWFILGVATPVYIGATNYTFNTNVIIVGGVTVTPTNSVIVATPAGVSNFIGTNTTVTTTAYTNATNYTFVINALSVSSVTNNEGTAFYGFYNLHSKATTALSTNVYFTIYTDTVYTEPTNDAYVHGETIKHNGEIEYGTTDEIRTMIVSNSTMQLRATGYANGRIVPVSLGSSATSQVVYSQNYHWTGNGSGVVSNTVPSVVTGDVVEGYYKLLK